LELDYRVDAIDQVIRNAIDVMDSSIYQVYEIGEGARSETAALKRELDQIKEEIHRTIEKVDQLEKDFRRARVRLSEVSRDFNRFTEHDIRQAYETATKIQLEITRNREKEANLRSRREELSKRIRNVERTVERAEMVISQMSVVREYLSGDLNQVTRILESARNRQLLGLKIIHAQEEERKRIAREIHDGMAQSLANVILRAEIAERMVGTHDNEMLKAEISDLKRQVRLSLEEVRKMIFNLRPMALDDLGFIPALRKFAQDFEEKYKIRTRFELTGKELRLPSEMEAGIYRIVQEAFTNIHKHANASFVLLDVTIQPGELQIIIEDNGTGFSTKDLERDSAAEGERLGIVGMQERVELLEGEIRIESRPGEGTRIKIRVPIREE
jgi:two-component system sensor histidine kinase DegS